MKKESLKEIDKRNKKIKNFLVEKKNYIFYLILAFIVFIGTYIRTFPMKINSNTGNPGLWDITTNTWTLGPDLDPFLFLRWAKDIVANGSLMVWDSMRYVPLGYNTSAEMKLLSYMIAWLHNFLSFFSEQATVTYAAVIFPVIMFALTGFAFFLFARKVFYKKDKKTRNIIALIATAFFVLIPSLISRTIAGIPEKESAAFFFMFIAFYFFLESMTSKTNKKGLIFGILSGISTALMALIWGGFIFIFFSIPFAILISFIIGKVGKKELISYTSWLIVSFLIMMPFSTRYTLKNLIASTSTGFATGILFIIWFSFFIIKNKRFDNLRKKIKLPKEIFSILCSILILMILILIFLGPSFVSNQINNVKDSLITPMTSRLGVTIAENKQPYFINDWKGGFGPVVQGIPLFFWLFFFGAIILFYNLIKKLNKKEKLILTFGYTIFLIFLIFSRYSSTSIFNGTSGLSITTYFLGWIILLGSFIYVYYKRYKNKKIEIFKEFEFSYILYFMILTLGLIGARGGIRLIMVLGAISPIAVAYLIVKVFKKYFQEKEETKKFFLGILLLIVLISSLFTLWTYYQTDKSTASSYIPGVYQWQWQEAMGWVRENTESNAVFAHWWDYGYWVQSIGERGTILDGGNSMDYWNHLMGRHILTGSDERVAIDFLYAHNGTHLLIDSTDIGKYTAFSSIGADENYDRFSWISTFFMDESQTKETQTDTTYIYTGGTFVDEDLDLIYNGEEIFLPKQKAMIGAIISNEDLNGKILQPEVIFVYNNNQYLFPLKYAYFNGDLYEFDSGIDAGIFIFPKIDSDGSINRKGALMYLSSRTIHSNLANLYLFNQTSEYFKLVHSEDNLILTSIKEQGIDIGEFIYYNGLIGPIKIWEVEYPQDIEFIEDYISTEFPSEDLKKAKEGEY